jgi:hypothetical protein
MSGTFFILSDKFSEVKAYVKDGLPEDHWSRGDDYIEGGGRPLSRKVWFDTDSSGEHEYDKYKDADVRDAARFRDGLVSDSDVYKEFHEDFGYTYWEEEYKKHSEYIYRYLQEASAISYSIYQRLEDI